MIVIIDYGMGNLGSIVNMFKKTGHKSLVTSDIDEIENAEKLILPGVGAFGNGMKNLKERNLIAVLNKKVQQEKIPVLGICLGMHLMTKSSEEDSSIGLGWIDGSVVKFQEKNLKIPHMGWNIIQHKKQSRLFNEMESEKRFYFVHSYFVKCDNETDILTTTPYGNKFVSAFNKDNIYGVQFHPEKSHKFGMNLLKNFVEEV